MLAAAIVITLEYFTASATRFGGNYTMLTEAQSILQHREGVMRLYLHFADRKAEALHNNLPVLPENYSCP